MRVEGKIFAAFTVATNGRVRHPRIVKGLQPRFDAAVLRVLRALPRFTPGTQNGRPVPVVMTLPVTFQLK